MRTKIFVKSLAFIAVLVSVSALSEPISFKPQAVKLIPQDTFIPPGFDDNDNAQVVISGYLPNTCYKAGGATAKVDEKEKKIYIQNTAYVYAGCWCAEVIVPYMHTINLGIIPTGQYQVLVQDEKLKFHDQGQLNVVSSKTTSPDDYLYAPVRDVFLENGDPSDTHDGGPTLVIRGQYTSNCMRSHEVRVNYRDHHIIEIFPIVTMTEGPNCHAAAIPFESKVKLQNSWSGSTLIYVRSLNGQSISKVIEL